jgi:hypothetical protein
MLFKTCKKKSGITLTPSFRSAKLALNFHITYKRLKFSRENLQKKYT